MNCMLLTERGFTRDKVEAEKATKCTAVLVLKDEMHESVWAYPMESKSVVNVDCMLAQSIDHMKTCKLDDASHVVAENDNESAIVEIQEALAGQRAICGADDMAIENSRVRDSSSNGEWNTLFKRSATWS